MLTISISEALQGPAALSAWEQQAAANWGLEALEAETGLPACDLTDPVIWGPWPTDAGFLHEQIASEAAASLALATAIQSCAPLLAEDTVQGREAAWASPLRVPLPAPLAVEPLSELELELELDGLPEENVSAEPQKIAAPPSLKAHNASASAAMAAAAPALPQKPTATAVAKPAPPGMKISQGEVAGQSCTRVDWKIDDFSGKLQASMGRPVVSPAFDACSLSNLRLMVFPDARDAVKRARGFERKALYANMVKQGPLYGSLKLKADGLERATVMTFSLLVGGVRHGPTTYDFSEQAVLGLDDFGVDWLQQVDKASGAINVGIEIVEVRQK